MDASGRMQETAASAGQADAAPYLLLLKDTAKAVARSTSLEEALASLVGLVARRLDYAVCSIYLAEADGTLVLRATHGLRPESVGRVRMAPSDGLTGLVYETERGLFLPRADSHPRYRYFPETGEERFSSFGGVPLLARDRCHGVLIVQSAQETSFPGNEVMLLETLAEHVVGLIGVSRSLSAAGSGSEEVPAAEALPAQPQRRAKRMLLGLGTSGGVAGGEAALIGLDPLRSPPPPRPFTSTEEELGRYRRARAQAAAELEATVRGLEASARGAAAAVFRAHRELLEDDLIAARVVERIELGAEPVERAVHRTFRECAEQLAGLPSPHLREKAADLLDVGALLLAALGLEASGGLPPGDRPLVVVAEQLSPAQTARLDPTRVVALVTEHGSPTSHASILARSLGIPAIVAVPELTRWVAPGDPLLVDGDNGFLFVAPRRSVEVEYQKRRAAAREAAARVASELAARRGRGPSVSAVELLANVGFPVELQLACENEAAGVGLLRTEFFFLQEESWPDVAAQEAFYRRAFRAAPRGPLMVRLLDAGGDKALPYMEPLNEPNPILGLRAVRLLLHHWEVGRAQVEALLRAAAAEGADLRLIVPLVTASWELTAVRQMVSEVAAELGLAPCPLGMMVETPSVLYQLQDLLPRVEFVSVGTNDLTQYLLAVDRENERVRHYYSPFHPAVLRALDELRRGVAAAGKPASICGEVASSPLGALAMLALGYRRLSVRPRALPALRCLIHCVVEGELPALRELLLAATSPSDVERHLRHALREAAPFLLEAGG